MLELVRALRTVKPQVQALLVIEEIENAWRVGAIHDRVTRDGDAPSSYLVNVLPLVPGSSCSCGDAMPYNQTGKCSLCCLASARVMGEFAKAGDTP